MCRGKHAIAPAAPRDHVVMITRANGAPLNSDPARRDRRPRYIAGAALLAAVGVALWGSPLAGLMVVLAAILVARYVYMAS